MKANQLKAGVILSYLMIVINCIIGIFLTPFMVRTLGKSQYGLYQLLGSFVSYMAILDFGLGNTIIRYVAQYREKKDKKEETKFLSTITIIYLFIISMVIILGVILYFNLSNIFGKSLLPDEMNQAKTMFIVLVCNLIITLFSGAFAAIIIGYEKYIFSRSISLLRILSRTILLIILLKMGYKALSIVMLDSFLNILILIVFVCICTGKLHVKIRLEKPNKIFLNEILGYSFFIFLNVIIDQTIWNTDQIILGIKMSTAAVAVYAVGTTFSSIFMQFSGAISGVFLPKVTKMVVAGCSNDEFTNFMIRVGRVQFIVISYIYVAFILLGRQFIQLWIGNGYINAWITALLVMTGLFMPLTENAGLAILQAKKKNKVYVLTYLVISIFNVVASIYSVKSMGIIGPALMTMIGLIIGHMIFVNCYYHFKIGINMIRFFKELLHGILPVIILSGIVSYACTKAFSITSWSTFVVQSAIYTIVYALLIWFLGTNKYEKDIVLKPIKKFREITVGK